MRRAPRVRCARRPYLGARRVLTAAGTLLVLVCALTVTSTASAQRADSTLARVQRMVNAGDRDGARALADSILQSSPEGSPAYAEALYARAFASASAVEAERDYLRVSVEYPFSPRAEDATMMVAQLKLARSDRAGARRNFERLVRDHPSGAQAAKAAFWAGRLALEDGDLARGCQSLATSRASVSADDVELVNQIDYYRQRCTASALAAAPVEAPAPPPPTETRGKGKTSPAAKPAREAKRAPDRSAERPITPPVERAATDSVRTVETETPPPPPAAEKPVKPARAYSVQVAAFPKQRDADALRDVLQQRGYQVRVWGTKAPFRVRVGRYATREEADAARLRMKASRVNGIVVEAEPQ